MDAFTLIEPDDFHVHLRDEAALMTTVPHTARQFARAIVMPNLQTPITTVKAALAYRNRILEHVPHDRTFEPLMTLYLTEDMHLGEIRDAANDAHVHAIKWYPKGATTNSDSGVSSLEAILPHLEQIAAVDIPLLIHGEVTDEHADIFDREALFIEHVLTRITNRFPNLRIVLEHITTKDAVAFVSAHPQVGATITAHHLLYNRNAIFQGGIKPHYYCLPILKSETHRQALLKAAFSGSTQFFLGTDSAPHAQSRKESACGCAGIYTAHAALELYAEIFDTHKQLDMLEAFASKNGAMFYRLPMNRGSCTLMRQAWTVPNHYPLGDEQLIPHRAGESVRWKLV